MVGKIPKGGKIPRKFSTPRGGGNIPRNFALLKAKFLGITPPPGEGGGAIFLGGEFPVAPVFTQDNFLTDWTEYESFLCHRDISFALAAQKTFLSFPTLFLSLAPSILIYSGFIDLFAHTIVFAR